MATMKATAEVGKDGPWGENLCGGGGHRRRVFVELIDQKTEVVEAEKRG
jgi:hypothetical protein